jgi:hypothetical protein
MQQTPFPRVTVPGVDPDAVEALQEGFREHDEHVAFLREQKDGLAAAMFRLRKPIGRRTRSKRRRPTAHVLRQRSAACRSAYLKETAA